MIKTFKIIFTTIVGIVVVLFTVFYVSSLVNESNLFSKTTRTILRCNNAELEVVSQLHRRGTIAVSLSYVKNAERVTVFDFYPELFLPLPVNTEIPVAVFELPTLSSEEQRGFISSADSDGTPQLTNIFVSKEFSVDEFMSIASCAKTNLTQLNEVLRIAGFSSRVGGLAHISLAEYNKLTAQFGSVNSYIQPSEGYTDEIQIKHGGLVYQPQNGYIGDIFIGVPSFERYPDFFRSYVDTRGNNVVDDVLSAREKLGITSNDFRLKIE